MQWPFRRKAVPAQLSLNKNFYLSVLSAADTLPPLLQVINPDGSNNAIKGFGAPLTEGANKDILNQPIGPGSYVLTTADKLTVLQMDVFPRNEVPQFQIPQDQTGLAATNLTGEALRRAQDANTLANFLFKGYDPGLYISVQFMLEFVKRFAESSEAVVADPLAETYRMPDRMRASPPMDVRIDFRDVGSIKLVRLPDGLWISTRGLSKFNIPEFEMYGISEELRVPAAEMVVVAAQQVLVGVPMKEGETAFSAESPLEIVRGTRQPSDWGGRSALELRDKGGEGAARGVEAWRRRPK
ncbi:MAG: hypothetical protein H0W86_04205 [Armatimonadetes bacterium]|nr:hypothetical protein [Armatimonadota bacterium]